MTTTPAKLDLGQEIARTYWLTTDHVFSRGYPDSAHCALCGISGSSAHIAATPEVKPTITAITERGGLGVSRSFDIELSCNHGTLHRSGYKRDLPKIGSTHDCFDCNSEWLNQNHPGLPEAVKEQIETLIPKCPTCMQPIDKIPFVRHTVHEVYFDVDGQTGLLDGESSHDDTVDEQPEWVRSPDVTDGGWYTGELVVSCKDQHNWYTTALAYRYRDGTHSWKILKP